MRVRVEAGGRLHFGFQNLSLAHERLYGGVGVTLTEPRVELTAEPAESVVCSDPLVADCAAAACELLGVEGVRVAVEETVPRHVGLGSGTHAAAAQSAISGSEQTTDSAGSAVNSTWGSARATPTPP